jgi:hypothetical protein
MMYGHLVKCIMEYKLTYAFYVLCLGFVRKFGIIIFLKKNTAFYYDQLFFSILRFSDLRFSILRFSDLSNGKCANVVYAVFL